MASRNAKREAQILKKFKAVLGENSDRASREPQRFYLPAYIGPRGWFGLRLDGEAIDWSEVPYQMAGAARN